MDKKLLCYINKQKNKINKKMDKCIQFNKFDTFINLQNQINVLNEIEYQFINNKG